MNVKFFNKSSEERRNMILSEKVLKTIIILTIPMFMMGIVQALIPITDGLFLNNKSGYVIAGAIGFSQSVIGILNAFSQGLSVAASAIIGQLYGKGDIEKTKHSSVQILVLSFGIGLLLSPLCLILSYIISRGVNEELSVHVFEYLGLYSFVLPFLFMAAIFNSIKNGTGHKVLSHFLFESGRTRTGSFSAPLRSLLSACHRHAATSNARKQRGRVYKNPVYFFTLAEHVIC